MPLAIENSSQLDYYEINYAASTPPGGPSELTIYVAGSLAGLGDPLAGDHASEGEFIYAAAEALKDVANASHGNTVVEITSINYFAGVNYRTVQPPE
jgi:hypothetical protein